jgi:hypothetical protein
MTAFSFLNIGCAQTIRKNTDTKFVDFVNSFEEEKINNVLKFGKIVQKEKPMTKEEALNFVYHTNDSTRLYCNQYIYSNETEKIFGVSTSLYLPNKSLKIDMGNYYLIGYSFFECQDPNKILTVMMNLLIMDRNYNIKDSILIYQGNDYDYDITGLLNPRNSKMFLLNSIQTRKCYLYRIDTENLKFEVIRESNIDKTVNTDDLPDVLEILGWKEVFIN